MTAFRLLCNIMHMIPEGLRKWCPLKHHYFARQVPLGFSPLVFLFPLSLFTSRTVLLGIVMFWINMNDILFQTGSFISKVLVGLTCWRITDFCWFLLEFPENKGYGNDLSRRPWEEHDDIITYTWCKLGLEYLGFAHSFSSFVSQEEACKDFSGMLQVQLIQWANSKTE